MFVPHCCMKKKKRDKYHQIVEKAFTLRGQVQSQQQQQNKKHTKKEGKLETKTQISHGAGENKSIYIIRKIRGYYIHETKQKVV